MTDVLKIKVNGEFVGVPAIKGESGEDGFSPIASVSKSGTVTTITITDKNGTTTEQVNDGIGTITDVKVNNASVVTNNVANITMPTDLGDLSNNAGYTKNAGTVTSVNNTSPDSNGNVSLTIPTVNNATLTIQKNGTQVQTFTANASSDVTCNITVPTNTNDLTNGAGFITSSALTGYQLIAQPLTTLSTSGTIALSDNTINSITPTGNITFTLPTVIDNTAFHQILVQVNLSTVYTITLGTSYYFNASAPDLSATGVYNLIFEYDKANQYWVVGSLSKGA